MGLGLVNFFLARLNFHLIAAQRFFEQTAALWRSGRGCVACFPMPYHQSERCFLTLLGEENYLRSF